MVASGICTSNCRCALTSVPDPTDPAPARPKKAEAEAPPEPPPEPPAPATPSGAAPQLRLPLAPPGAVLPASLPPAPPPAAPAAPAGPEALAAAVKAAEKAVKLAEKKAARQKKAAEKKAIKLQLAAEKKAQKAAAKLKLKESIAKYKALGKQLKAEQKAKDKAEKLQAKAEAKAEKAAQKSMKAVLAKSKKETAALAKAEAKAAAKVQKAFAKEMAAQAKAQAKAAKQQARLSTRPAPAPLSRTLPPPGAQALPSPGREITAAHLPIDRLRTPGGVALSVDADAIEGGSVRVRQVRGKDGQVYTEVEFKLTSWAAEGKDSALEEWLLDHRQHAQQPQGRWSFRARSPRGPGGMLVDTGDPDAYQYHGVSGGASVTITGITPGQDSRTTVEVGRYGAMRHAVRMRVPSESVEEALAELQQLGLNLGAQTTRVPTEVELDVQVRARLAAKFDPAAYADAVKDGPVAVMRLYDQIAARSPEIARMRHAEMREVMPGHVVPYSQALADELTTGARPVLTLFHDTSASADVVASMLEDDKGGLASSQQRYSRGVFVKGQSTERDFETGGADGLFVRIAKDPSEFREQRYGFRLLIDAQELGRLDWWAYNFDHYGRAGYGEYDRRQTVQGMRDLEARSVGYGNEVMFPKGISGTRVRGVVAESERQRQRLLAVLRGKGLTAVNGIPLEQFVTVAN